MSSAVSSGVLRANLLSMSAKSLPPTEKEIGEINWGLIWFYLGLKDFRFTSNQGQQHP